MSAYTQKPHGKNRLYKAYISVSCSGPEALQEKRGPAGMIRSRAAADLRYTTADVDWLYSHFRQPNYDTGTQEHHIRLVNPDLKQFTDATRQAASFLHAFTSHEDWEGGQITLLYAGHGAENSGALVLRDHHLSAEELLNSLSTLVPHTSRRCRLDVVLDSCFSAAFITSLLAKAHKSYAETFFPCTLFAASLHDEFAWEFPRFGHGVWTHSFMMQTSHPNLAQSGWNFLLQMLWRRWLRKECQQLYNGGVSFITEGSQHSMGYENGHMEVHGKGYFDVPPRAWIDSSIMKRLLECARRSSGRIKMPEES